MQARLKGQVLVACRTAAKTTRKRAPAPQLPTGAVRLTVPDACSIHGCYDHQKEALPWGRLLVAFKARFSRGQNLFTKTPDPQDPGLWCGCVPRPHTFGSVVYQDPRLLAERLLLGLFVTRIGGLGTRLKRVRAECLLYHCCDLGFLGNEKRSVSRCVPNPLIFGRNPYQDPLFLSKAPAFSVSLPRMRGFGTGVGN